MAYKVLEARQVCRERVKIALNVVENSCDVYDDVGDAAIDDTVLINSLRHLAGALLAIGDDNNAAAIGSCIHYIEAVDSSNTCYTYLSVTTDDEEEIRKALLKNKEHEKDLAEATSSDRVEAKPSVAAVSTQESETTDPPPPKWTEKKSNLSDGQGRVSCDGPCSRGFYSLGNMHMCRLDNQVFCNDCFALPEGRSWRNSLYIGAKCSPTHEFFHFPPVATQCEEDELLLSGKIMKKREWIARIRKDFGILK